jgi:hypothetical protein
MPPSDSPRQSSAKRVPARLTLAILLLAGGCAGHSLDCLTGTSDKGCAPGTMGHQQMVQEQQGQETTATIDDARCRSIAPLDSPDYLACRQHAADVRRTTQSR